MSMVRKHLQELKKAELWEERAWILRAEKWREKEAGKVEEEEEEAKEWQEKRLVCMEEVKAAMIKESLCGKWEWSSNGTNREETKWIKK